MPCRALEAFRRKDVPVCSRLAYVLMPCRALEAFRRWRVFRCVPPHYVGLNALSGIGGVQTPGPGLGVVGRNRRLNALSGIGGVQTGSFRRARTISELLVLMPCRALEAFRPQDGQHQGAAQDVRLNALSGIGGVQTNLRGDADDGEGAMVLMPCRALEAFRRFLTGPRLEQAKMS